MDEIESLCRLCEAVETAGADIAVSTASQRIAEKRDASFSIGCAGCLPSTNGNMPNGYSPMHLLPGMEMSIWALHSILLKGRV